MRKQVHRIARRIHDRVVYLHLRLHSSGGGFCQDVTNPPLILGSDGLPDLSIYGIAFQALFLSLIESGPMLSPSSREAHRQARRLRHRHEETGSSRYASHVAFMHVCMHACDRPTVGCSFISDGEEISGIHWICGKDVPDPEVQSIMPG